MLLMMVHLLLEDLEWKLIRWPFLIVAFNTSIIIFKLPKCLILPNWMVKLKIFYQRANVTTFIDKLSFKDHRGFVCREHHCWFLYTKKNILLKQLEMKTPLSEMKGRVELKYNRKIFQILITKLFLMFSLIKLLLRLMIWIIFIMNSERIMFSM